MAKWIMQDLCDRRGVSSRFQIDSCGTGAWHAGHPADPRSAQCAAKYGLAIHHTARQITRDDLALFDLVLVMDRTNLRDVLQLAPGSTNVKLLRSFDPHLADANDTERDVPDPYYGGEQGFEMMYQMLSRSCENLMQSLHPER